MTFYTLILSFLYVTLISVSFPLIIPTLYFYSNPSPLLKERKRDDPHRNNYITQDENYGFKILKKLFKSFY